MAINLNFKDKKIFLSFTTNPMHEKLSKFLWWWLYEFFEVVITSAYRENDTGVHGQIPLRGLDLRSWIYTTPKMMEKHVNEIFTYDPKRPELKCCILHEVIDSQGKSKGMHFHLQVHDRSLINGRNF